MVCLIQVIQSFPFLPGLKDVPRRLKKFIDWNKVLSNTSCVERGEDARTRIGSDVCKKTIDQRVYAIKKPTAILQTKFLSRGMSSAMRSREASYRSIQVYWIKQLSQCIELFILYKQIKSNEFRDHVITSFVQFNNLLNSNGILSK